MEDYLKTKISPPSWWIFSLRADLKYVHYSDKSEENSGRYFKTSQPYSPSNSKEKIPKQCQQLSAIQGNLIKHKPNLICLIFRCKYSSKTPLVFFNYNVKSLTNFPFNTCGSMTLQSNLQGTSKLTHVKHYTPMVHMSSSKMISYTIKPPKERGSHPRSNAPLPSLHGLQLKPCATFGYNPPVCPLLQPMHP